MQSRLVRQKMRPSCIASAKQMCGCSTGTGRIWSTGAAPAFMMFPWLTGIRCADSILLSNLPGLVAILCLQATGLETCNPGLRRYASAMCHQCLMCSLLLLLHEDDPSFSMATRLNCHGLCICSRMRSLPALAAPTAWLSAATTRSQQGWPRALMRSWGAWSPPCPTPSPACA